MFLHEMVSQFVNGFDIKCLKKLAMSQDQQF